MKTIQISRDLATSDVIEKQNKVSLKFKTTALFLWHSPNVFKIYLSTGNTSPSRRGLELTPSAGHLYMQMPGGFEGYLFLDSCMHGTPTIKLAVRVGV